MKYKVWVILTAIFISGCATQGVSTRKYIEDVPTQVKNEIIVPRPYTEVWDVMVKELSKSFFVINNIDKESRIINVSFSTNSPAEYVDCGKAHRTYTQGDKREIYDYDIAGSSEYKIATRQFDSCCSYYAVIYREAFLEGRSNIYIAPKEKDNNSTIVTVNTRYILTIKVTGQNFAERWKGGVFPLQITIPQKTSTWTCNTNQPERHDTGGGESVTCFSKGKLENEILSMINR